MARGHRDAGSAPGPGGFAAVQYVFRQVDQIAADIDGELQAALREIDAQILSMGTLSTQAAQDSDELSSASEGLSHAEYATEVSANNARRKAHHLAAKANDLESQSEQAAASKEALLSQRERVHGAASGLLDSWAARANELAAHHARGYRQGRSANPVDLYEPPSYPAPDYAWANGKQVPMLGAESPSLSS